MSLLLIVSGCVSFLIVRVVLVIQTCQILWDPTDCTTPSFSVRGIIQVRLLEWVAIPYPRDLPDPGITRGFFSTLQILYCLNHQGNPSFLISHF